MDGALNRQVGNLAAQEAGDFRLINCQCAGSLNLREAPHANGVDNTVCKVSLRKPLLWVRQTDIGKDVSAIFFDNN